MLWKTLKVLVWNVVRMMHWKMYRFVTLVCKDINFKMKKFEIRLPPSDKSLPKYKNLDTCSKTSSNCKLFPIHSYNFSIACLIDSLSSVWNHHFRLILLSYSIRFLKPIPRSLKKSNQVTMSPIYRMKDLRHNNTPVVDNTVLLAIIAVKCQSITRQNRKKKIQAAHCVYKIIISKLFLKILSNIKLN